MVADDAMRAAAIAEPDLVAAHKALMHTRGLQFDFNPPPQIRPPAWLAPLMRFLEQLAPVMKYVLWAGLALAAVAVIWIIVRELLGARLQRRKPLPLMNLQPDAAAARTLLEEADHLAAAGRFGEAIHLLLLRSVDHLTAKRPGLVRPSLTSRDIMGLAAMPQQPREAFTRVAQAVERSLFAGRPVAGADFVRCRADYETFAFSEAWR